MGLIASERQIFSLSGPFFLTDVDWNNAHHRRSVAASLVQGVYVLEQDRQQNRQGPEALAPPWWEFFHFQLIHPLVDNVDFSIFGAIYEFKPQFCYYGHSTQGSPRYVVAFRGTITKPESFLRDLSLDLHFIQNELHCTSRFESAMEAVQDTVTAAGDLNVWIAGHSLGSAVAMLAGKNMAKMGTFLESFLFNPPFFSAPIERIKDEKVKHGVRIASSLITAGLAVAVKGYNQNSPSEDPFLALSAWVPCLFVNPADDICSEYAGYFEHRKKMEEIGAGGIEKLATQNSIGGLFMHVIGKEAEPLHLLPSANLTINRSPSPDFKRAHGIHQWWRPNLQLECKIYRYS
ncbi:PREDICTED: GDSL esterase/lipase At4g10955-like [Nelumbo nucifera]|uniref:GDSL esterase/lipase At4g10955-like n=1 Tax=Nelumbo nucifera TaxID=4432 RepID=A0A1U8ATR4_NELNU|nr:PREDICTED: GDSL esterase/lipase At4g10955-like [Nelumbo nucifera]XP_010266529.1 PREDICTED: GDSL esterase/lipase At4g10955-like [Nelumbo nucifera]XP_010266530.1 PREDICTED: GDSL esterase/lipase At4g10955-like [Nelumbo nucifera]XP_010266531.1 PREDICTED: GDSL esterase/lipase At4g10955-like [Nelumbo nucifera]